MTPIYPDLHRPSTSLACAKRRTGVAMAVAAALGVLAAPSGWAQATSPSAADIEALRNQVQQLQRQIDQLQQRQQAQERQAQATPPPPPSKSTEVVATKPAAPVVSAGPVNLTFGGFAALEGVYRDHNQTADIGSNYNAAIPYPYQPNDHISEFRLSARQSRFSLLAQPANVGHGLTAEGYLETDFLSSGVSSNSAESNSYTLRIRHFYGVLKNPDTEWYLLAGQNWSLATLYPTAMLAPRSERIPQTIDAQYVVGFNWTRNPQIRFVKNFGKTAALGISLESPQASVYTGCSGVATPAPAACGSVSAIVSNPGGSLLNSTTNYSIDFAPDMIVKFALDPGYGHFEVYGLGRGFRARSPGNASGTNHTTYGGSVGAGLILPLGSMLDFQLSGLIGTGNGRYGSAQLPDATLRPDGTIVAINEDQVLGGFLFKPTPLWTFYLYGGLEEASRAAYVSNAAGTAELGYGGPLYNNSGCLLLTGTAATCIANTKWVEQFTGGTWWKVYQGEIGNFQIGLQYSYTKRKAFEGVGGAPSADINMGFFSFRYYPYQR
jgi:type II secretory pathway pseudopilin PulG